LHFDKINSKKLLTYIVDNQVKNWTNGENQQNLIHFEVFILPARQAGSFAKNVHRTFSLRAALSQAKKFRHFCDFQQTL
jgi:hypothetical protein